MDEEEWKKLLEKLLRKLLRRGSYRRQVKPLPKPKRYKPKTSSLKPSYTANRIASYQPKYKPKPEKPIPYHKSWTEPTPYKPKERLIYDPEVKQLLKQIEGHLADSEPDAEQMLKQLEENPELFDKISDKLLEKMNEDSEKLEELVSSENKAEVENSDQDLAEEQGEIIDELGITPNEKGEVSLEEVLEKLGEKEGGGIFPLGDLESSDESEQADTESTKEENNPNEINDYMLKGTMTEDLTVKVDEAESSSEENGKDAGVEDEVEVFRETEADESLEADLSEHETEETISEPIENVQETEPMQGEIEPDIIEQIEAEDLSPLEAELFPVEFIEPLEAEEKEVESY